MNALEWFRLDVEDPMRFRVLIQLTKNGVAQDFRRGMPSADVVASLRKLADQLERECAIVEAIPDGAKLGQFTLEVRAQPVIDAERRRALADWESSPDNPKNY